eukprot:c19196_g1_i1 orf=507-1088(-)
MESIAEAGEPAPELPHHIAEEAAFEEGSSEAQALGEGNSERVKEEGGEEAEEEECGFCLFMKGGPCRDSFVKWQDCVEKAETEKENIVSKCYGLAVVLKECMEVNSDYYEPVLAVEREFDDQVDSPEQNDGVEDSEHGKPKENSEGHSQEEVSAVPQVGIETSLSGPEFRYEESSEQDSRKSEESEKHSAAHQ